MVKTNFTKAEAALSEAMQRMMRTNLLSQADKAQGNQIASDEERQRLFIVQALKRGLKRLHAYDADIYKKLAIKKSLLNKILENPGGLAQADWQNVLEVKARVDEMVKLLPVVADEELVKKAREKHVTKRFNVSDKWLPLD